MVNGLVINLVSHESGWHVYIWRTSTSKGKTHRRQINVVWVDHNDPLEAPQDLLRRIADTLEVPYLARPLPGLEEPPASPGGP